MTRTTASATSSITSPLRSRARAAPAVDRCPASFSEMFTTRSRSCSSGAMPKSTPVRSEMSSVKARTPGSSVISAALGRLSGLAAIMALQSDDAERRAERAAGQREHDAFGHELAQQPPAAGAKRGADRVLLLPRLGAREQQVGQVGAGDEQDEAHGALQHPQRGADAADDVVLQAVELQAVVLLIGRVHLGIEHRPLREHRLDVGCAPATR